MKNQATGECGKGSYFCMPRIVIIKNLEDSTIRKTLDGLIENKVFDDYFI